MRATIRRWLAIMLFISGIPVPSGADWQPACQLNHEDKTSRWPHIDDVIFGDGEFILVGPKSPAAGLSGAVFSSRDGVEWQVRYETRHGLLTAVVWTGAEYIAGESFGPTEFLSSVDGVHWDKLAGSLRGWENKSAYLTRLSFFNNSLFVSWGDGLWIRDTTGIWGLAVSRDQLMNMPHPPSPDVMPLGLVTAFAHNSTTSVAVQLLTLVWRSENGSKWAEVDPHLRLSDVVWDGKQFVGVGPRGNIQLSKDGIVWEKVSTPVRRMLWGINWNGEQYLAVGECGTMLTSKDALTWMQLDSGTSMSLRRIAWSGKRYVVIGDNDAATSDGHSLSPVRRGIVLESEDGFTWRRAAQAK